MRLSIALMVMGLIITHPVCASEKLIKDPGCTNCHQIDRKLVGPSFKQIAEFYRANPPTDAHLFIMHRSMRRWGHMPMPIQPNVTEQQAKDIVKWINTLK
jgi:cytochrome c